jgi:hypothetical protein
MVLPKSTQYWSIVATELALKYVLAASIMVLPLVKLLHRPDAAAVWSNGNRA